MPAPAPRPLPARARSQVEAWETFLNGRSLKQRVVARYLYEHWFVAHLVLEGGDVEAIDRADLIIAIGHDTIEKPPFIMGPKGPQVVHVSYMPANVEQVYFPQCEVIGDVGPSLELLADRLEGKLPHASALLSLRESILAKITDRATEGRWPPTPQRIVHDVRQVIPEDGIVALDNGMYKIWFARNYRTQVANTLLLDNALATMGAGLPSAVRHGVQRRQLRAA